MDRKEYLQGLLEKRIVLLDGAMGTMIQKQGLQVEDYTLEDISAPGCNEFLNLSRGDVIYQIHQEYLSSGADIIETNTFCANAFNLAEYGLSGEVGPINLAACEIAREAAADYEATHAGYAFVAGVLGPTNRSLSFSEKVEDPAYRQKDFSSFLEMYREQVRALLQGGVDLLLIETVFDTLVAKSAIIACLEEMEAQQRTIPLMVSVTFSDQSGRTLSGQTLEAFVASLVPFPLFSLGLNCSTGPKEMLPLIEKLSGLCPFYVSAHPNAGFPDKEGNYQLQAQQMAKELAPALQKGYLNILGGCCGTTPVHIKALKEASAQAVVRQLPSIASSLALSGMDAVQEKEGEILLVGERTNVAGSRKFARLIKEEKWEEALQIAREQVAHGSSVLDLCMDASMLDAERSMKNFLRYIASDPSVAKAAIMIDSSDWEVVCSALGEVQGRGIVNSISLKEGEETFISHAKHIARYGHAMVVMLFDEEGQAATYERKIAIAKRSYSLLHQAGIRDEDIIFDANVLSIATGIEEHDTYARDFILATRELKRLYPRCHTSGGVSNLSFSFRGNDALRSAMHALLLELADLDMAIINPASLIDVQTLNKDVRSTIEHALMADGGDLADIRAELINLALTMQSEDTPKKKVAPRSERSASDRLYDAVVAGDHTYLSQDLEAMKEENPLSLVEGPLMDGMKEVGRLFGKGKLFLPQVVRSARTMKLAVDILQPRITAYLAKNLHETRNQKKLAVLATVKGDVHDIGKNIVALILTCNGFEVIDLGVMVPSADIYDAAIKYQADIVGLSGLITPSLKEMERVISLFEERGASIPIFVGGATTSEIHTAVKLSVRYSNPVIQTKDASAMALAANEVVGPNRLAFFHEVHEHYRQLRENHQDVKEEKSSSVAVGYAFSLESSEQKSVGTKAKTYGVNTLKDIPLADLVDLINWNMYCAAWKVPPSSEEGVRLIKQAKALLEEEKIRLLFEQGCRIVYGVFPAKSDRLAVQVSDKTFYFLRDEKSGLCIADMIAKEDTVGLFVTTSSLSLAPYLKELGEQGDTMRHLSVKLLADRLAEALAEKAQQLIVSMWGEQLPSYLRPAPGYPSWNDHSEKGTLFSLLDATERIGVQLTESFAMNPPSSVCGMLIGGEHLRYFALKHVSEEQLSLYAKRKSIDRQMLATLLSGMEY
jgi:5-methyltetrahydrofolate--homocysteine methyltransferase